MKEKGKVSRVRERRDAKIGKRRGGGGRGKGERYLDYFLLRHAPPDIRLVCKDEETRAR